MNIKKQLKKQLKKHEITYSIIRKIYRGGRHIKRLLFIAVNKIIPNKKTACRSSSKRCEEDFLNTHYEYSFLGKDSPTCCMTHLYELICFVDEVLRENNIEYFINYGTLLGAIRHRGFIPWDTDVDISVNRGDKDKVIEVLEKSIQGKNCSLTVEKNKELLRLFVSDKNSLHIDFYFFKKDDEKIYINDDGFEIVLPVSSIFPLKEYEFYNKKLLGPAENKILTICYGDDVFKKSYKQWSLSNSKKVITDFNPAKIEY